MFVTNFKQVLVVFKWVSSCLKQVLIVFEWVSSCLEEVSVIFEEVSCGFEVILRVDVDETAAGTAAAIARA